ncbi:nucleotidyltransferase family protein [Vibrio maritimus]|uniref:nucleotidyltransferase family protein n=1 Tax=Vibrio maritimus TaxID=990268 RepID=UPI0040681CB5
MNESVLSKEVMYIILSCLKDRKNEETALLESIEPELNTNSVLGLLLKHRLLGYFSAFSGRDLYENNKEVQKVLRLLLSDYQANHDVVEMETRNISDVLEKSRVRHAYLKGVFYKLDTYQLPVSKSNDTDMLVSEKDISTVDECLRALGYWQTFGEKVGFVEASKRDKVIQILNHHDLVPYMKRRADGSVSEIDINIHFDSTTNQITDDILDKHYEQYCGRGYLSPIATFLHLCVHFEREFNGQIWIERKSDLTLYKVVDLINVYRHYDLDNHEIFSMANDYKVAPAVKTTFECVDALLPEIGVFNLNKKSNSSHLREANKNLITRLVGV